MVQNERILIRITLTKNTQGRGARLEQTSVFIVRKITGICGVTLYMYRKLPGVNSTE